MGIYTPLLIGNPVLPSITAHEIFHLWNVKRLRPADMVPYTYDRWMPTPWLWVSEGITDYYADVALVRAGVIDSTEFLALTAGKMQNVADVPVVSLEDASLSAWIGVTDGTGYIYYPKGSLAGMLLDIRIRAATGNRKSLDDVMRSVYRSTYEKGRGFTAKDWWGAVTEAAGGVSFDEFDARYIDGREPFPYATDFAMAGLTAVVDSNRVARLGIQSSSDSTTVVLAVTPGSAYAEAGGLAGDELVTVGDFDASDVRAGPSSSAARYGNDPEGTMIPVVVRRGGQRLTLQMPLRFVTIVSYRLVVDPNGLAKRRPDSAGDHDGQRCQVARGEGAPVTYIVPIAYATMVVAALLLPTPARPVPRRARPPRLPARDGQHPVPSRFSWPLADRLDQRGAAGARTRPARAGGVARPQPIEPSGAGPLARSRRRGGGLAVAWPTLDKGGALPAVLTAGALAFGCLLDWMLAELLGIGRAIRWLDDRIPALRGRYSWGTLLFVAGAVLLHVAWFVAPLWVLSWQPIGVGLAVLGVCWAAATGRTPLALAAIAFAATFTAPEATIGGWLVLAAAAVGNPSRPRVTRDRRRIRRLPRLAGHARSGGRVHGTPVGRSRCAARATCVAPLIGGEPPR